MCTPVLSFLFIFVRGEAEAGVTAWVKARLRQGINCLAFCWRFPPAEKKKNKQLELLSLLLNGAWERNSSQVKYS